MAKVEADKVLIKPEPINTFVPTPSYRRVPVRAEAYADNPGDTLSPADNLKSEIKNVLVHEVARTLYTSNILTQSIEVHSLKYEVNYELIQQPKAAIHISAWRQGEKIVELSLN